jgi:penicillin-binding protein 1A
VSKFIPKHKDISSQFSSGASTEPALEPASENDVQDVQQDEKKLTKGHLLLKRCQQGATITLNGLKSASSTVIEQFTGPRQLHRRYWFWLSLGVGSGAIALGWGWIALERSVPNSTADVLTFVRDDTITIKAADGTIIQQIGPATREMLKVGEAPKPLIQAFLATEDRRFQDHHGIDYLGIIRAALSNLRSGGVVEGGSTITQQLARIVYFDQERTVMRKLKEMRMAQKIEHDIPKDKILERYLNLVYLGSGAYGVTDAAWVYFSKPVKELTLPEMAVLAGLPSAPTNYSPFVNAKVAKERRDTVLLRMQDSGYITAAQAKAAIATPLKTKRNNPKRLDRKANYFTEYIQQELPKYVPKNVLKQKGLTIETTLNLDWQAAAEDAVKQTVERDGYYERFEQAAMVAIDPRNGQIKAMVGGKDFYNQQFNRVTQAQRQPGSTFKTFVYSTAIAAGFSPYRGYLDGPYTVDGYTPKNYSDKYRGWINLLDALTYSANVVAVKALIDIGWDPTIAIAKKMGIESTLKPTYSMALGASEVNLLELTSAYGTLAAKGVHNKPHGISRIIDQHGKVIYKENFKGQRVLDEDTSSIMTWMLRGVVKDGTGRAAQLDERPVAGKTGTSDEARDLWFIGYIPQVVTGVWLGNDDNTPTSGASGTAAYTWRQFMVKAVKNLKTEKFPERPSKLEDRKGTIKAAPIKPKRALDRKATSSESSSESSYRRDYSRSSRRDYSEDSRSDYSGNSRSDYGSGSSGNYGGSASEESYTEYTPRRRRRDYNESYSEPAPRSESYSEPAPRSQSYSEPAPRSESYSEPAPRRRSRYQEPVEYTAPRNSGYSNPAPRQAEPRRESYQPAPEPPPPAEAPAPRAEQNFEPAPAADPPAPPASRKEPEAAAPEPIPAAPPPEAPAPKSEE